MILCFLSVLKNFVASHGLFDFKPGRQMYMRYSSTEIIRPNANDGNLGIGFNDPDFSERILHIQITPALSDDSDCCTVGIQVESLHINSLILALKSPFFYKLFKNGMKESQTREVKLRINASEEKAFMDLLNFMYSNTLSAATNSDLLDVLIVADKFEVSSCMRYCIRLLLKMPMSLEYADSILDLPSTVLVSEIVRPLIGASTKYLFAQFKDFNKCLEDAMGLSLSTLEFVLGSVGLRVDSEDVFFEFILNWVRTHYPKPEERQIIISNHLLKFLCFPHMSYSKLKEVVVCPDFEHEKVSKLVTEALFYKAEVLHASKDVDYTENSSPGHLYHDRLITASQHESPSPRRVIYFDLTKEECENLFLSKGLQSQSFLLGGRWFYLFAECESNEQSSFQHFGVFLGLSKGSGDCKVAVKFAAMKKSTNMFHNCRRHNNNCILTEGKSKGLPDAFNTPWTTFMSDDSDYFVDGILHLRVDLTIVDPQS